MGRKRKSATPANAHLVTTYDELEKFVDAFAQGQLHLLAIIGEPGLSKSQSIKKAIGNKKCLLIKGRKSPIDFYLDLYRNQDSPVVIDDADDLLGQKLCQSYLKALTETDEYKRLDWGTQTKILEREQVPKYFHTRSPVCIATNYWNDNDPIFEALESRAEIINFAPNWGEVYAKCAEWFPDQEILDYLFDRLPHLKSPDMRILVKALQRKNAGGMLDWRKVIDGHCDDAIGMQVRMLLDDPGFKSNQDRARALQEAGHGSASFYRRMKEIKRYRPVIEVERLKAAAPRPQMARPADGLVVPSDDDE